MHLAGLLPREASLVVSAMVLGESALMPMACFCRRGMCEFGISWILRLTLEWGDRSHLLVDEALVLAAVLVGEVERVARELDAAGLLALDQEGVLAA